MFGRNNKKKKAFVPPIPDPHSFFRMPPEEYPHEGTWLQWPHNSGWDDRHVERYESSWVAMTKALHVAEKVHLIVYNQAEHRRVQKLLEDTDGIDMELGSIDFYEFPTDDVWVRDNGPIFVFGPIHSVDLNNNNILDYEPHNLHISNWLFNAWGNKSECFYDNYIPLKVGHALHLPVLDIPMVHEGGSVEVDGRGTLMAKKSSILNSNRNPGWTQANAEAFYRQYLGVTNFIWLEGKKGGDITDDHIDGTARFANGDTIVTFYKEDFLQPKELKILQNAVDVEGNPYKIVHLPCTKHKLKEVGDYGFYLNYYVGNKVVLVPSFGDPHDAVAVEKIQSVLYPNHEVISIPFAEIYRDGGMIHCVTQQQPKS